MIVTNSHTIFKAIQVEDFKNYNKTRKPFGQIIRMAFLLYICKC